MSASFSLIKDCEEWGEWWLKAAELKDEQAQYNLGAMYDKGLGVPVNSAKALEWYLKSAEQGYATAQYNLGYIHYSGLAGQPVDLVKAREWWLKSAEQGYSTAQYNLGVMYATGQGVARNNTIAYAWCSVARRVDRLDELAAKMSPAELNDAREMAEKLLEQIKKNVSAKSRTRSVMPDKPRTYGP